MSDCVTLGFLFDAEYPQDLLEENLLRLLSYETQAGITELVALVVGAAGCESRVDMPDNVLQAEKRIIESTIQKIEAECIRNVHPAAFPALRDPFASRLTNLLTLVSSSLAASEDNTATIEMCCELLAQFMQCKLQSLRYVGTLCALAFQSGLVDTSSNGLDILEKAIEQRCTDSSVQIRKLALKSQLSNSNDFLRGLNDSQPQVRLQTIRLLLNTQLDDNASDRIYEMAAQDVDLTVRRAALRFLAKNRIVSSDDISVENDEMMAMLGDEDEQSRILAAELLALKLASNENTGAAGALEGIAKLAADHQNLVFELASGLVRALGDCAAECAGLIAGSVQPGLLLGLLVLLPHLISQSKQQKRILSFAPQILRNCMHSDEALAAALRALSCLDLSTLAATSQVLEGEVSRVEKVAVDLFQNRSNFSVVHASALVLASLPATFRNTEALELYHEQRLALAEILGPRGVVAPSKREAFKVTLIRLSQLAKLTNVTSTLKLPIFAALTNKTSQALVLDFLKSVAFSTDNIECVEVIVKALSDLDNPPVDDILKIIIAAKMRNLGSIDFTVDIQVHHVQSEDIWRAAVAADVV